MIIFTLYFSNPIVIVVRDQNEIQKANVFSNFNYGRLNMLKYSR